MLTRVPLRAVLFDWDGTLLDSFHADASAYMQMFRALGIAWDLPDLKRHYSPDWHNVFRAAGLPADRWEEADRLWRHFYEVEQPVLQPGAEKVVKELCARYPLGLVTSGSSWRVRPQLQRFAMDELFAAAVFGDDVSVLERKPHPAALWMILHRMELDPAACVYVGDAPEDVEMAKRIGMPAIGVTGHSAVAERLHAASPEALIDDLGGLAALLFDDQTKLR